MGFSLLIQTGYGGEALINRHPEGKPAGGGAVFEFLGGLQTLCDWTDNNSGYPDLKSVVEWYRKLERSAGVSFFPACQTLLDCIWGDGGDLTEYREDEYEFFKKRNTGVGDEFTEEMFQRMVRHSRESWKPIGDVIGGVRLLLNVFEHSKIEPLEGFYDPEYTKPDFEALLANLELLAERGNKAVRLNFA